jgi:Family of unknown function (DUF5947)
VTAYPTLRRLAQQRPLAVAQEQCELCSQTIPSQHRHLLEMPARQVRCVCYPCSVLFAHSSGLRLIPQRRVYLADFDLSDVEWASLRIPVGIAFVLADGTAFYPGALGATQAFLEPDLWQQVQERNPILKQMEPDVEALLVNRVGDAREHYLVPIDDCYRLVGLIRTSWRGLTGGREVWRQVDEFFQGVKGHAADR